MKAKKTDNAHLNTKIGLRMEVISQVPGVIRVLDCYHGHGVIWEAIKKQSGRDIKVDGIEKEKSKGTAIYRGECNKWLKSIDLTKYHIVDLDAYGIPVTEIITVLSRGFVGHLCVTLIQSQHGRLPHILNRSVGISRTIADQSRVVVNQDAWEKTMGMLYDRGIGTIRFAKHGRKIYFTCSTNKGLRPMTQA